jgi:hypothetical protein
MNALPKPLSLLVCFVVFPGTAAAGSTNSLVVVPPPMQSVKYRLYQKQRAKSSAWISGVEG